MEYIKISNKNLTSEQNILLLNFLFKNKIEFSLEGNVDKPKNNVMKAFIDGNSTEDLESQLISEFKDKGIKLSFPDDGEYDIIFLVGKHLPNSRTLSVRHIDFSNEKIVLLRNSGLRVNKILFYSNKNLTVPYQMNVNNYWYNPCGRLEVGFDHLLITENEATFNYLKS